MMRRLLLASFILPLALTGCLMTESPEELERLTKEDPVFEKMIVARDQIHHQIAVIRTDLLARKRTMEEEAARLRAAYDGYAVAQKQRITQLNAAIEGSRKALKSQLDVAETRLDAKQVELEGYQKTLSDVRRMLKESKGIELSAKERQKWDERMLMLTEKIRPLEDEIRELRLEIRLKNQKIRYLH